MTSFRAASSSRDDSRSVPKELFDDDAGVVGQVLVAEHADHRLHRRWRHGEVDQRARIVAEAVVRLADGGGEILAAVVLTGVRGLKGQAAQQVFEHVGVEVVDRLLQAAANLLAEFVVGTGECRPDPMIA